MKKMKRFLSCLVALVLVLCLVQVPVKTKAEAASNGDNKTYVKVYYTREDGNYDDWNVWVWLDDADGNNVIPGHAESFDGVDSKGAYKIIAEDANAGSIGVIVRTDSWAKCYDGDVKVDLSKGDTELDFSDATKNYEEVAPQTSFDNLTVKLHYYRFDENYTGWDVWGWTKAGSAYSFEDDADGFGKVCTMSYDDVTDEDNAGCIVRLSDWSDREQSFLDDGNRFFNKTCANADGVINAYVVQGDKNIYYTKSEANTAKEPKILTSRIDTLKNVSFTTTFEVPDDAEKMKVYTKDGDNKVPVDIESLALTADKKGGTITLSDDLDFANKTYYLDIVNSFGNTITGLLTLGDIYNSQDFADLYTYNGDLGAMYSSSSTKFVLWAPTATNVQLLVYGTEGSDLANGAKQTLQMVKGENGTWSYTLEGDQNGVYYNYLVDVDGTQNEVVDPYAKAVGVNGNRAMVLDLDSTDPEGWNAEARPTLKNTTDAVVYEMHIRDFTIGEDSGASLEYRGKFKGAWQSGTTIPGTDIATGIDHLKELGVNTVQIMPTYDYNSVDESKLDTPQFNWGYDPQNYSSVEGSYSSNPYDASIRIKEFKELIHALHEAGIRVTMDVVYNHTALSTNSNLNLAVPNYYYRQNESGAFTNGSGCGNELASDRSMVGRLIVDSVVYWAKEFHIDGFRFDLMAVLDKDTMLNVRNELDKIDPNITVIGEGWTGGTSALSPDKQSLKANMGTNFGESQIAAFSDDMRDGIRGNVFSETENGFISGNGNYKNDVKFGIMAATQTVGEKKAWAKEPYQCVNYASCHDNWTLYDRLKSTNPDATEEEVLALDKLSASLVYTSQGIPFMLSGEEFARTKENADGTLNENSYNSSDSVNAIGWSRLKDTNYNNLYQYYRGLIAMRGAHKAFRMDTAKQIADNLSFIDVDDSNIIAYTLNGASVNDSWSKIAVIVNANKEEKKVTLPSSDWVVVVNGEKAGTEVLDTVKGNEVTVPAQTSYVLVNKDSYDSKVSVDAVETDKNTEITVPSSTNWYSVTLTDIANMKDNNNSIVVKKSDGDIILDLPYSAIPEVYLDGADSVTIESSYATVSNLQYEGLKNILGKVYTFNVTVNKDGKAYKVTSLADNNKATIKLTLTDEELANFSDTSKIVVYRVNDDGTYVAADSTKVDGNVVTFITPHFSNYILAEKEVVNNDNNNNNNNNNGNGSTITGSSNATSTVTKPGSTTVSNKKTNDNNNIAMIIVVALAALAVVGISVYSLVNKKKVRK